MHRLIFLVRNMLNYRVRPLNVICHQSRSVSFISKFYHRRACISEQFFSNRNRRNVRIGKRGFLLGGLLSLLGFKDKEAEEDPVISVMKLGILNMQREEYDKAESILHLALKLAQERADLQAQRYIYDLLANNAYQKGDLPKAEKLFVEVMKGLISSGMTPDDNAIIEISLKLASIYSKQNDNEKAEEGFSFCINTQEKKMKSIDFSNTELLTELERDTVLLWAMSFDWYAKYLVTAGRYSLAQTHFEKALAISEKVNGPDHPQTLVLLNDIGSVASLRKEFVTALEYFEKAIARGVATSTPDLPAFYCNLGATYLKNGDFQKASVSCTKALKLAGKFNNEEALNDAKECLKELRNIKLSAA